MLKKTITFNDLDGNAVTEDFYFNLNKAELTEMELRQKDGLSGHLQKVIEADDRGKLIDVFKEIIKLSVGKRSEDGRRFIKNEDVLNDFMQSEAYSELFMELATEADAAVAFITAVVPADLEREMLKNTPTTTDVALPATSEAPVEPAWLRENREPTPAELRDMSPNELRDAYLRKQAGPVPPAE